MEAIVGFCTHKEKGRRKGRKGLDVIKGQKKREGKTQIAKNESEIEIEKRKKKDLGCDERWRIVLI